jgi:hypothetical protein
MEHHAHPLGGARPTLQTTALIKHRQWWSGLRCVAFWRCANVSEAHSSSIFRTEMKHTVQSAYYETVPAGGEVGSGAVRGECVLVGGLKGCYWWKTVWRIRELQCYIQTENIYQLGVACSECTCTVYCGCCDDVLHWITLNSSEHIKAYSLLFVQW